MALAASQDSISGRHNHLRELGLPTLFGAVVLLGSATLLLFANVSALRGSLHSMEHSQRVLLRLADLEAAILSNEMTVRGYALTGDARFIRFQKQELAKCEAARTELLRLSTEEPLRAADYRTVMQDVSVNIATFAKLNGDGPDKAQIVARAIVDPATRATMQKARAGLTALRTQEIRDLGERQRLMADQITRAFLLAAGIILAAFVLGGIGVWAAQLQSPFTRSVRGARKAPSEKR
ncbi:MAG: CHASE3 domain-containing protein [Rhizomicrobium sp.]|nr:CHASE3 domain-containing protein [Rhizomicrobium sp.]